MAEALASAGIGHNLSRASFLDFCTDHSRVERELAEVAETRRSLNRRRKDLRKNMAAAGVDIEMFDRHLVDVELTPEELAAQALSYAQMMEWRARPPGYQPSLDMGANQTDDERAFNVHELHAVDGEGFDAGKAGHRSDSNPYKPGTESFMRWHNAWTRGQTVAVGEMGGQGDRTTTPAASGSAATTGRAGGADPAPRRRPGRPRKNAEAPNGAENGNGAANGGAEDAAETPPAPAGVPPETGAQPGDDASPPG